MAGRSEEKTVHARQALQCVFWESGHEDELLGKGKTRVGRGWMLFQGE